MVASSSSGRFWVLGFLAVGVLFGEGCKESPAPMEGDTWAPERVESPNIAKNYFRVGQGRVLLAGQPNEAGLDEWKEDGVKTVVNLRPDEELPDFDEKRLVEERGMEYVHIPVTSQGEHRLTDETVDAFVQVLDSSPGPVVIHCGSANRVSALWAVYLARKKGVPPEQALEWARASGMKDGYAQDFAAEYMKRNCSTPPNSESSDGAP